jgi:hypothetical protein
MNDVQVQAGGIRRDFDAFFQKQFSVSPCLCG